MAYNATMRPQRERLAETQSESTIVERPAGAAWMFIAFWLISQIAVGVLALLLAHQLDTQVWLGWQMFSRIPGYGG